STQATGPASSQLRKPGQRKQSMSKPSRPALPSLSEMPPLPTVPHSYAAAPKSIQNSPSMKQSFNKNNVSGIAASQQLRAPGTQPQTRALSPPSVGSTKLSPIPQRLQAPAADQRPASPSLLLFSVGDRVTVETLNISGTLRFLGPINIKPGMWAGIEMDVHGTGKNDGSISGVSYFSCPPNTGIFVLASKLSRPKNAKEILAPPRVSPSTRPTLSIPRPPSAQSNASDRSHISTSGTTKNAQHAAMAASRITAGSRASKYIGVTASQLKQRSISKPGILGPSMPTLDPTNRNSPPPSKLKSGLARPSVGNLRSGSGITPPRRRRDSSSSTGSGVSQSQSPKLAPIGQRVSRATTPNQQLSDNEASLISEEMSNRALQEKIQKFLGESETSDGLPLSMWDQQSLRMKQLEMKVEVLETENATLAQEKKQLAKQVEDSVKGHHARPSTSLSMLAEEDNISDKILQLTELIAEKDEQLKSLEESLNDANKKSEDYLEQIKGLERHSQLTPGSNVGSAAQEATEHIARLEKTIELKSAEISEMAIKNEVAQKESNEKILSLQENVDKLKAAGQETINIYEQKVSALEQQIAELKKAGAETILLYEEATAKVEERDAKIDELQKEAEKLRSAGVEAIDVYEKIIENYKAEEEKYKSQLVAKDELMTLLRKDSEALKTVQRELADAKAQLEMREKQETGLRNELHDMTAGLEQIMRADAKSRERIYELEDELRESQALVKRQQEEITMLKDNIQDLMAANSNEEMEKVKSFFESETKRLEGELDSARKSLADLQGEKRTVSGELDNLKNEKSLLEKRLQDVESRRSLLVEEVDRIRNTQKDVENEKSELSKELEELKLKMVEAENVKSSLSQELDSAKVKLVEVRGAAEREISDMQAQIEDLLSKTRAFEQTRSELDAKVQELNQLNESHAQLKAENEQQKTTLETVQRESAEELESSQQEIKQLRQKIKELALAQKNTSGSVPHEVEEKLVAYEEQIAKYEHDKKEMEQLVKELTRENVTVNSENKKILSEQEKLMEAHKQVETECLKLMDELERLHSESLSGQGILSLPAANVEGGFEMNEAAGEQGDEVSDNAENTNQSAATGGDSSRLQQLLAEKQSQLERVTSMYTSEIRELRQKNSELERAKQRELSGLTKDVAELESLIESKIFREADLEEELQKERHVVKKLGEEVEELKEQLKELRSLSGDGISGLSDMIGDGHTTREIYVNGNSIPEESSSNLYCEICEEEGHDIITCKAVFGTQSSNNSSLNVETTDETQRPYCENCEEHGLHWTEDCPNQDETF
ncbi:1977_t:CDS:2, partial [Paraglomus occultum]